MVGETIGDLSGRLLLQCRPRQAKNAARVASAYGTGLVLTGPRPAPVVSALRAHGFTGPILCDATRYSGRRRIDARAGVRAAWTAEQHDLGLVALTDSGYLATHDWRGLRRILSDTANQPSPVIATLPLAAGWFEHSVDDLITEVDSFGVPVAVAIEHNPDPIDARHLIDGLLDLRTARVPVLLLRSGISALGALSHGMHAAAIGTNRSLRHLSPHTGCAPVESAGLAAFAPPLLSHHPLELIGRVTGSWHCDCVECGGRPLTALARTPHPEASTFRHSLSAQLELWSTLAGSPYPIDAWHEHRDHAIERHQRLVATLPDWRPPADLCGWLPAPVPDQRTDRSTVGWARGSRRT